MEQCDSIARGICAFGVDVHSCLDSFSTPVFVCDCSYTTPVLDLGMPEAMCFCGYPGNHECAYVHI